MWRGRTTEALRGVSTLKEASVLSGVSVSQWFSGHAEIDALVYELYGLTEEEIAIVDGRR